MAFEEKEFNKLRRDVAGLRKTIEDMRSVENSVTEVERLRYITKGLKGRKTYFVATSSGGAATKQVDFLNGILIDET